MGTCYSKKASGWNRSYTTIPMASSKLDDASRLARPTPYARIQNANVECAQNRGSPLSIKYRSYNPLEYCDPKNVKNTFQSSIPRYSSSLPTPTSVEQKTIISNLNDNETLHVVNNNSFDTSRSASNIPNAMGTKLNKLAKTELMPTPKSVGSKSCPDKILSPDSEEKGFRTPGKSIGVPRQLFPKTSRSVSQINSVNQVNPRQLQPKSIKNTTSGMSLVSKSPSQTGFESKDTLSEFDSGLGNSLNDRQKPEDSDTIKDLELLEESSPTASNEENTVRPINSSISNNSAVSNRPLISSSTPSNILSSNRQLNSSSAQSNTVSSVRPTTSPITPNSSICSVRPTSSYTTPINVANSARTMTTPQSQKYSVVKAPAYKRELNGKWSLDVKQLSPESPVDSKPHSFGEKSSPRERHSFKINASDSIFSTYASYKGLLSYQKKSFKPFDPNNISKDKPKTPDKPKTLQTVSSSTSCIPKIRKPKSPLIDRSSLFYVQAEHDKPPSSDNSPRTPSTGCNSPGKRSSKNFSIDSDEKSDSTGITSPPSDAGDRDFLIDDEIADQPDLTLCCDTLSDDSDLQSLQLAVSELHALQISSSSKMRTDSVSSYSSKKSRTADPRDSLVLGSDLGSSCSSIASDDLMMDYEKSYDGFPEGTINEGLASPMKKVETEEDKITPLRADKFDFEEKTRKRIYRRSSGPLANSSDKLEWRQRAISLPLRPPRQMSISEADDGCLKLDSSSYRLLCQDLNGVKTLLLRLKTVIQETETINPFDQNNSKNMLYHSLVQNDYSSSLLSSPSAYEEVAPDIFSVTQENTELRKQVFLLEQQLEEKERTIHLLQQQMTKYLTCEGNFDESSECINAATQTERKKSFANSLSNSSSSADDSIETLVSIQEDFEKTFRRKSQEQDHLTKHLKNVTRLLESKPLPSYTTDSEC